jgi:uncharacterized membrane-anchored protein YhcB (DUF1043 family)
MIHIGWLILVIALLLVAVFAALWQRITIGYLRDINEIDKKFIERTKTYLDESHQRLSDIESYRNALAAQLDVGI